MAAEEQPQVPTVADYWPGSAATPGDAPYKRSGKTKKDLLKCYNSRITASKKWREDEYDGTWERLIDLYRGKHFSKDSTQDRIAVNVSFSTINVIVPSVAVNYPEVSVSPRDPSLSDAAMTVEAAVNYWWRKWDYRAETKRTVKDSLVLGHGWAKTSWRYKTSTRQASEEEQQDQYEQMRGQANDYAEQYPHLAAELPSDTEIMQMLPDSVDEIEDDRPVVERVSPFDIFIDPEAMTIDDMKWIAQRIVVPLERVKKDKRYKASARNNLSPDMATNPRWRDDDAKRDQQTKLTDDIQRVTLFEYWDIEHQFYCLFAKGAEDFLIEPTDFPYAFGHPFVPLGNYEVPDHFYNIGDLEMLEPMQHELNAVRSDMMNHRKRWQRAYLAKRDKLDPAAIRALESDVDNRIVYIDGDEPLADVVVPIAQTALDPQMYNYSEVIESDIELVSGISEYQRGSAPEIRRTATEATMIQDATNARVSDKLAQIEVFMAEIARRLVMLAQQYMTGEQVARIVGPDGQKSWVQFDRNDIEGEFDFTVEAGSTQPKNEQFRRQNALQLVQALSPYVGVAVDPQRLVKYVLEEGFGVKDASSFLMQAQQQGPQEKLIEKIDYRDAPPDIQRQMEQSAGFQPSQIGGVSPNEMQGQSQDHAAGMQLAQQQHDAQLQLASHGHDAAQSAADQQAQDQAAKDQQMMQMIQMYQQAQQAQQQQAANGGPSGG